MGIHFNQIPGNLKNHIKDITKSSGLPDNDDSLELMSESWLEKKDAFEKEIENLDMEEVDFLDKDDPRGALIMTYSGSLINIGPMVDDVRNVEYSSIGLRSDVPDVADNNGSILARDIDVDSEVEFEKGPVNSTSAAFKIAVCNDALSAEDQENALNNATMVLTQQFADINKTLIIE